LHPGSGGSGVGPLALVAAAGRGIEKLVDNADSSGAVLATATASQHRLLFATPTLTRDVHISGTPRVRIRLASSKPAVNLSVWLVQLPIEGGRNFNANLITRGWADPQNHSSPGQGEELVPGRFYDLSFTLQPDDQVIAAGRQIALMIFSSDRDFTLWPQPGTELSIDLAGTSLELPVVGGPAAVQQATGAPGGE
jgi:X-Pro dipeptidyl-peptidase